MNETSNEEGEFNEGHSKNSNGLCPDRSGDRYSIAEFKGKVEGLSPLGVKEDKHTDSFMVFQKEFHTYVLAKYKHSSDIAYLVKKLKGPLPRLLNQMPTIYNLKK